MNLPALNCVALACLAGSSLFAGPVDDGIVIAMRLSERPNYSWTSIVDDDARTYDIVGKTSPDGFTQVRMPIVNSIRRRLGRGATDNLVDAIFRGNVECVLATDTGWKTIEELPIVRDTEPILGTDGMGDPGSILTTPGAVTGGGGSILPLPKGDDERGRRVYSNLQMGISHPHEDLGVIVSSGTELRASGEVLTGTLTELGAQLLLVRDGQPEITPEQGAGTFTIWMRAGMVQRFQVKLEGVLAIKTGLGTKRVTVNQTTHTVIRDVGTTRVEVPAEARRKLGG